MIYNFKCACGKTKSIKCNMNEIKNKEVICDCGKRMNQVFSKNMIIPDSMKAENISEMSYLNNSMKSLPSGKMKALY